MKIRLLSLSGMVFGFGFALSSIIRYYILYPDPDRVIVYSFLGITIMAVSYLFDIIGKHDFKIERLEEYQEDRLVEE